MPRGAEDEFAPRGPRPADSVPSGLFGLDTELLVLYAALGEVPRRPSGRVSVAGWLPLRRRPGWNPASGSASPVGRARARAGVGHLRGDRPALAPEGGAPPAGATGRRRGVCPTRWGRAPGCWGRAPGWGRRSWHCPAWPGP
ncbi:hypothetical protein GPJ59_12590 [Streptomyces bambusae]|uniref:Uncharacterized protein n=2 Tax=Streptomyces bambusae TaxID=1550616 RepID=A0ABS6Z4N1_9ACTN|nr:hypothetical protein [Streptomyces bambusae]